MRHISLAAAALIVLTAASSSRSQISSLWQQPAVELASKIANLLGPGRAYLTVRNLSSIPAADLPAIQKLLSDDLRAHGVTAAGPDSANSVKVTLSESAIEHVWVAEVIEGDETQVVMVDAGPATQRQPDTQRPLMLSRAPVFTAHAPVLATLDTSNGLVVLEPDAIAIYGQTPAGWRKLQSFPAIQGQLARDPHGILRPSARGQSFEAWLAGQYCTGVFAAALAPAGWTVNCRKSDDPWILNSGTVAQASAVPGVVAPALPSQLPYAQASSIAAAAPPTPILRAFYNAARNYFTGVIVPNPAVDIPPFYSAALVPRPAGGEGLLVGGIDGKVQLLLGNALSPIDGVRDWGSDFAALHSACGAGTQIVASASGQAPSDSLRAYALPALEAIPASEPLAVDGIVTALWTEPGGKTVMAVVRTAPDQYEVDRVSATCN